MNTVETLERKLGELRNLGYEIFYDWFGGTGGGACQMGNRKCLFLDLALSPIDHLGEVDALLQQTAGDRRRAA
jgi:hypothetical protein